MKLSCHYFVHAGLLDSLKDATVDIFDCDVESCIMNLQTHF